MAKNIRRMLAMVLVMCMFVSALPMQALAAEDGTTTETTVNDGVKTEVTTTQSTSTDSSGNVTVTVEFSSTSSGTTSSGSSVSGSASGTSTTVTDSANNVVEASSSSVASTTTTTGNTSTTVTETKQGETSTTPVEGSTTPDAEGFTSQGGSQTTVVESTETTTEVNTEDSKGRPLYESEKVEGEETTVTTTTEVKTKQETDSSTVITNNDYVINPEIIEELSTTGTIQTTENDVTETPVDTDIPDAPSSGVTLTMTQSQKQDEEVVNGEFSSIKNLDELVNFDINNYNQNDGDTRDDKGNITKSVKTEKIPITQTVNGEEVVVGYNIVQTTTTYTYTEGEPGPTVESNVPGAAAIPEGKESVTDYVMPEVPEGSITTDETTGNTTTVTVEKIEENGEHVGYKTVTVVTDKNGVVLNHSADSIYRTEIITKAISTTQSNSNTTTTEESPSTEYVMPEAPKESTSQDEVTGNITKVTVQKIEENGEHVGYKTITVITDKDGVELERSSESIFRTTIITKPTVTTETTTDVTSSILTTEKNVTTTVNIVTDIDGKELVPIYYKGTWGWVYKAELIDLKAGTGHGEVRMVSLKPDMVNDESGTTDSTNDLYNRPFDLANKATNFNGYDYQWLGEYGLESAIRVEVGDVKTWQPHQFVLVDENGAKHYVYCADFEVSPQKGFFYDMENIEDADYYDSDAAKHIRAIASKGFWGTNSGVGSLESVKTLMGNAKDANGNSIFTKTEIDALTAGEALTATQAAIWKYGNSGGQKLGTDIVGAYYSGSSNFNYAYANTVVQKLYDYLITLTEEPEEGTVLITENNFATEASITVYDKVEDAEANLDTNDDNDVYNTSVSFSLLVEPTEQDDLFVKVLDDNKNVIRTVRISGNSDNDDSSLISRIFRNVDNKTYTIENLQIAEGVNITLNLTGTQNLDQGVYLYTSEVRNVSGGSVSSQTFVGMGHGERDVNLNVSLKFEVSDPQTKLKTTDKQTKQTNTEVRKATKTDTKTVTQISREITVTTEVEEITNRKWDSFKEKKYSYYEEQEVYGLGRGRTQPQIFRLNNNNLVEIPEEPVPLATPAITGDNSGLWVAVILIALCGIVAVNVFDKKRQHESF